MRLCAYYQFNTIPGLVKDTGRNSESILSLAVVWEIYRQAEADV